MSLTLLITALALTPQVDRITGQPFATRSQVLSQHGMVATSHPLATGAALDILKAGGSAMDAAITANSVLCFAEPTGCGLGGDLFAIVYEAKTDEVHGYNGSGRSPMGLTLEELRSRGLKKIPSHGPLPVSVPGCVEAWGQLHGRFGELSLEQVLQPAIQLATEGAPVPQTIAYYWGLNSRRLKKYPHFAETFMPKGSAPREGDVFTNPRLAKTLEAIAKGGAKAFYQGAIAKAIAKEVQDQGGFLTSEDLARHKGEWTPPVSTTYRGYEVFELPPNGQGIAALQMLNIIEPYDLKAMGFGSVEHLHIFIEAKKLAFEDRARFYADPSMAEVPVERLISKEYAETRRALIDMERAAQSFPAGNPALEEGDTIYLCVADAAGNMVSLIQSNYRGMGSGITPEGLGFVLQDRGELFDLTPGRANTYAPGKRPFHTIIPAFVKHKSQPFLAFGVMGGATQPQAHTWVLCNIIDFGMNLQEAGDASRVIHLDSSQPTGERMVNGGRVTLEGGFDPEVLKALQALGHELVDRPGVFGGYQAVGRHHESGCWVGASESRKDGMAAGY
ncbi:MAG: gamma-glutamyltransferase [Planctomycetes bacterium]|nr:gamma-glutamyltransferase [Planctomycetota bacterium]